MSEKIPETPRGVSEEEKKLTGTAYAWGKTARLLSKDVFRDAQRGTEGDFVAVDLCSALPLFPEILRGQHLRDCYRQAQKISDDLSRVRRSGPKEIQESFGDPFLPMQNRRALMQKLQDELVPKETMTKELIVGIVTDLIYSTASLSGTNTEQEKALAKLATDRCTSSDVVYEKKEETAGKSMWSIVVPRHVGVTLQEKFTEILGQRDAATFIERLARFLAHQALPHIRGFEVISIDFADPDALKENARTSFPRDFQKTFFYQNAARLKDHVGADISRLPVGMNLIGKKKNSVSFYSSIEGWPFYRIGDEGADMRLATEIADSLVPGGRAIFFPWQVRAHTEEDDRRLKRVQAHWVSCGLRVTTRKRFRDDLMKHMGDREVTLVDHSPVFARSKKVFPLLTLEKPIAFPAS